MCLHRVLHAVFFCPGPEGVDGAPSWGLPVLILGGAGGGKTSRARELSREIAVLYAEHSPAEQGEAGFGLVPVPEGTGESMLLRYPVRAWVRELQAAPRSLLCIDEITQAGPSLQGPLLSLVQSGVIGDAYVGGGCRRIATGNPISQGGQYDLIAPLANRFVHLAAPKLDATTWSAGLPTLWRRRAAVQLDPAAEEARVLAAWPTEWATACGVVGAFIRRRPGLLEAQPPDGDPAASGPWPSGRTWEYATRCLAASAIHRLDAVDRDTLLAGCVGTGAAGELAVFIEDFDLPDPALVLDGAVAWQPDHRLDRTDAVLGAVTALVLGGTCTPPQIGRLWRLLGQVALDVAHPHAVALMADAASRQHPEARAVLAQISPALQQVVAS